MCAAVSRRALPRPTAVDAKPCLFQFFRQLLLGSDFMTALPTATTARTLHDPLPYCGAAEPDRRTFIIKDARLAAAGYEVAHIRGEKPRGSRFISKQIDAGILLNTCGVRSSRASNRLRASIFTPRRTPTRSRRWSSRFMDIYHGKNCGGDAKAWLASMKADKRYLVDIWPKN
jgi:hypothetical protein